MLNFIEFIIGICVVIVTAVFLIICTGIIHTKEGYVSIIEKKRKFYKIENRKFSYYFPILYRKVGHYPTEFAKIKRKSDQTYISYKVVDVMKLYNSKKKIKDVINNSKNLEGELEAIGVSLIKD